MRLETLTYESGDRVARITLDRPERGNGITPRMPAELTRGRLVGAYRRPRSLACRARHAPCVLDLLDQSASGRGIGRIERERGRSAFLHRPDLVLADDAVSPDRHQIGYPPARVWGSPTTALWASRVGAMRAKRLLLTGDSLTGTEAVEWGLATEAAPAAELDECFERLLERVARMPINQLVIMKLLVNETIHAQGLRQSQTLGTFFDGIARHTEEGHAFVRRAAESGFREAVRERDEPFGDHGLDGFGVS